MALIGNGFRFGGIGKLFGGTALDGANPSVHEYRYHLTARNRNQFAGEGITDSKAAVPSGARPPVAWVMARKNGAMASRYEAVLTLSGSGSGAMGLPTSGTSSITFTVADAAGELISSGSGSASMTFTVANLLLTASLNGTGSSSFTLNTNTPLLGAKASAEGSSSVVFSCTATILPIDDTSPLRTASASFAINGSLVPYAIGSMNGSTVDASILTVDAIAAGVLAAALTAPIHADIRRVRGQTINGSGTTPDPWGP